MKKMWEGARTRVKPVSKVCFIVLYWINILQATDSFLASPLISFHEALKQMLPAILLCLSCRTCPSASCSCFHHSKNIIVPI